MTTTIEPPRDPKTPEEWQNAADAADALLMVDSARTYGLGSFAGGPEIQTDRCWERVHRAKELHGTPEGCVTEPREGTVERHISHYSASGGA